MSTGAGTLLTRRRLLWAGGAVGGLAVLGAGAGTAMAEDLLPGGVTLRRAIGLTGPDGSVPQIAPGPMTDELVASAARGKSVRLITMTPPGTARPGALPVAVVLHGRGADAQAMVQLGMPQFLATAVAAGAPPFALVAVDGGDASYWHRRTAGDDPQRMLLDELPGWLAARGFATARAGAKAGATAGSVSGALGISMGGSGALRYARGRGAGFGPVALLSPALFRDWADARTVDGFDSEPDWREDEPLLHLDQPHGAPLALWCGTEDPFCPAARQLAAQGGVSQAHFPRGEHTDGFWRRVLPAAMDFLGHALTVPRQ
ncbi:enterochelin esterase-like enzyme [Kitasatospora sp. MAP12-15]|uniref:alpha/beta hydrolase n=1 Tax=unclassified Kitasatospora TaxID=2633591 RepID=UPI0024732BBD|nr:alpha/beta hydrolase-fold protein [Kitasatospora sp. MAP12-44]MDH6113987.1 enterochelin esterase-like enzyme [Kitasatospora sp. MAP12-44]